MMYIDAKLVFKSGFMFSIRIAEVTKEDFILALLREYHMAIKYYNIQDEILDYVEIETCIYYLQEEE